MYINNSQSRLLENNLIARKELAKQISNGKQIARRVALDDGAHAGYYYFTNFIKGIIKLAK